MKYHISDRSGQNAYAEREVIVREKELNLSKLDRGELLNLRFNRKEQAGETLDKAFDGDSHTMFHNDWGVKNAYPYIIEGDFRRAQKIASLVYVPRSQGYNGVFLEGKIYARQNGQYKEVRTFSFENSGQLNMEEKLDFPPILSEGFKIVVNKAAGGFCSAKEIYFMKIID